jgi:hypothetical protein
MPRQQSSLFLGIGPVWRGVRRALVVGAAIAAMAAGGVRAEIRPIDLDGCSDGCGSDPTSVADSAPEGPDAKITMSLTGGGPTSGALLFDPGAAPAVLASGLPSPFSPRGGKEPGERDDSTYVDFDYAFTHPDAVVGPASFLSVASLTGQLTLGEVLSDSSDYFAAEGEALALLRAPMGPDALGYYPRVGAPYYYFSSADTQEVPMTGTQPKFLWMKWTDWSADSSSDSSADSSFSPSQ